MSEFRASGSPSSVYSAHPPHSPYGRSSRDIMQSSILVLALLGCLAVSSLAESESTLQQQQPPPQQLQLVPMAEEAAEGDVGAPHTRAKRTLFLKKKILGAGLLGFGLGLAKGYKFGYHSGPEVHHVYLSPPPPPVKYVEYIEKPVYVPRIVERPVFKHAHDYEPDWSPPEPSPVYGAPSW